MIFLSSPKGTPHDRCRRTVIKTTLQLQWKPMEIGDVPQKWMNFPLVFMVFHGFSRLVSKNKVSDVPRNDQCFFILKKKWIFDAHRRVPPTTGVAELWKKYFAMKTNGIRWCSWKNDESSLGTYILCVKFCKELSLLHV